MTTSMGRGQEPYIAVGLCDAVAELSFYLDGTWFDTEHSQWPTGAYRARCEQEAILLEGPKTARLASLTLVPEDVAVDRFYVDTIIGIDFHWQQTERQSFVGTLRIVPASTGRLTLINDVALEAYLTSVICSEMSAGSPPDLLRAHAIISRSWLLAQLSPRQDPAPSPVTADARIIWYDRKAHQIFDVCADDHCQRYQGVGRVQNNDVINAVKDTRGQVMTHAGLVCDARFSKCCGGVTECFRNAWADVDVPYLVSLRDADDETLFDPPLSDEHAARAFIQHPPTSFCAGDDDDVLDRVLPSYDRNTKDYFRWQLRLSAEQATELIHNKLGFDCGRVLALLPLERTLSARLVRLRIVGEKASLTIGKELEIRRALSASHLYSSAFVIDVEGPEARPEAFLLSGAGWGHGVGLCQIGAAFMAHRGYSYQTILRHYYPNTVLQDWYA